MVKKHIKFLITILIASITVISFASRPKAVTQDSAPYKTYTEGANGFVLTQTAYEIGRASCRERV